MHALSNLSLQKAGSGVQDHKFIRIRPSWPSGMKRTSACRNSGSPYVRQGHGLKTGSFSPLNSASAKAI